LETHSRPRGRDPSDGKLECDRRVSLKCPRKSTVDLQGSSFV